MHYTLRILHYALNKSEGLRPLLTLSPSAFMLNYVVLSLTLRHQGWC
jgi:hypothetical protein